MHWYNDDCPPEYQVGLYDGSLRPGTSPILRRRVLRRIAIARNDSKPLDAALDAAIGAGDAPDVPPKDIVALRQRLVQRNAEIPLNAITGWDAEAEAFNPNEIAASLPRHMLLWLVYDIPRRAHIVATWITREKALRALAERKTVFTTFSNINSALDGLEPIVAELRLVTGVLVEPIQPPANASENARALERYLGIYAPGGSPLPFWTAYGAPARLNDTNRMTGWRAAAGGLATIVNHIARRSYAPELGQLVIAAHRDRHAGPETEDGQCATRFDRKDAIADARESFVSSVRHYADLVKEKA